VILCNAKWNHTKNSCVTAPILVVVKDYAVSVLHIIESAVNFQHAIFHLMQKRPMIGLLNTI